MKTDMNTHILLVLHLHLFFFDNRNETLMRHRKGYMKNKIIICPVESNTLFLI